jgi:Ni,Fe-hydrogenase III small subunit
MSQWVIKGICAGIKTSAYPSKPESAAGVSPGMPVCGDYPADKITSLIECCPTRVFRLENAKVTADVRRCIHCYRCVREIEHPAGWALSYEWGIFRNGRHELERPFHSSIHICVMDTGDCGACLNEVKQLNNPYYNMHRLGFFITPTPRHADVLMVVGPVTDHMRFALEKAYDAIATPKRIVAVGACALTGGAFAGSFVCSKGLADVLPVDVEVPGNPPPPLAILHGLLVAVGRRSPAAIFSTSEQTKVLK